MKGKNIITLLGSITLILFFALYFCQFNTDIDFSSKNRTLTDKAIEQFEKDIKEGKKIEASNYIEEQNNYSNKATKLGINVSLLIEKVFNKSINAIFNGIDKAIRN